VIGSLWAYGLGARTLSYNNLNSACILFTGALVLYVLSSPVRQFVSWRNHLVPLTVAGVIVGFDFFVKFSTAVLLSILIVGCVVSHTARAGLRKVSLPLTAFIIGLAAGLGIYFGVVQGLEDWVANTRGEVAALSQSGHNPQTLLLRYIGNLDSLARTLIRHFGLAILGCAALAYLWSSAWYTKSRRNQYSFLALAAVTVSYPAYKVVAFGWLGFPYFNRFQTIYVYVLILVLQLAVLLGMRWPQIRAPRLAQLRPNGRFAGIAALTTLPIIGAFGTSNLLWLNALLDSVPWIALVVLSAVVIEFQVRRPSVAILPVLLVAGFTTAQIAYGIVMRPYLLAEPLFKQTVKLDFPETVIGLKVDPPTNRLFDELRRVLYSNGFRERDPVIGLYNVPGLVYLVGGVSPGIPTYFDDSNARSCRALARSRTELDRAFVLMTRELNAELATCMQTAGVDFPAAYVEVGRVYNPYSAGPYGWHTQDEWIRIFKRE
jgi:hypothetical protein